MRVPLSWLRELVAVEAEAEEIAERLTFSGTEVEEIDVVGSPGDQVVVAEVTRIAAHPKDPSLKVCTVNDGRTRPVQVVCGAPAVGAGKRYFLARAGGRLPTGRTVEVREIGGVRSEGVLCAEDELGLSDDHSGLVEAPPHYAPGTDFGQVFPPEPVFKLEITPNRGDCLSVLGIARELSALFGVPLSRPEAAVTESDPPTEHFIRVRIEDAEGCPRYTARVLTGLRVERSPLWMRRRLLLSGFRPLNNMVDITNYVLMECGHPLHAFDLDLLEGGEISVRRARAGEKIITIDGVERELDGEILVIADGRGPVAVAGIMGGKETEIRPSTTRVLLESAGFDPVRIRRGSKRLNLASESSYRFERYVDVQAVEWAGRRAAHLAQRICGVAVARSVVDRFPGRRAPVVLNCRCERVRTLTGMEIGDDRIADVLRSLGMEVRPASDGYLEVTVPSFRADVTREADLIEEVARIHGLEHIPTRDPTIPWVGSGRSRFSRMEKLRRALIGLGLQEAMNHSLTAESLLDELDPERSSRRVRLKNPLSSEQAVLRTSLLPQLLESLTLNASRQIEGVALFELGRVFFTSDRGGATEEDSLGVGLWGVVEGGIQVRSGSLSVGDVFLRVKGIVERLLEACGMVGWSFRDASRRLFAPGMCAEVIYEGNAVGVLGVIRQDLAQKRRLTPAPAMAELKVDPLLEHLDRFRGYEPLPPYPAVRRDISFVVRENVKHEDVMAVIRETGPEELASVRVFDIFYSERIGRGKKSMAYSLEYRSRHRTLRDEEVNRWVAELAAALEKKLGAVIREGPETSNSG